ncbi:MAG: hypothetical protein V2A34_02535 [Lentisphaerota bacterium]
MTPEKKELIRRTILTALNDCGEYMLPQETLRTHVALLIPGLMRSEFETELSGLDRELYVTGVKSALGGVAKWKIAELGKAALAE